MLIRLALISLVLAIWLVMPHSTEQSETPVKGADGTALEPVSPELAVSKEANPSLQSSSEKKKTKKKKRMKKKRRKEKRRKNKEKRRKRKKGRKGKKRKDRKKSLRRRARKRRNKKRKNKKRKKNRKRRRKGSGRKNRLSKRRGDARIRRGRRKRGRPCKTDSDCKSNQCCQGEVCIRPGRGLKCFGSCMCKARKKTKNFICVTKKKKMLAHFRKYGNDTDRVPRGHCRNITLTELESPSQKFAEIKSRKPLATTVKTKN